VNLQLERAVMISTLKLRDKDSTIESTIKAFYEQQKSILNTLDEKVYTQPDNKELYERFLFVKGVVNGIDGCLRIIGKSLKD
jgi:hypothetical protein